MFFDKSGKNSQSAAYNKFNFIVTFSNLNEKLSELLPDNENTLTTFAKKVSAPNMKVDFERAYANEYVHYFQNGAIHWESITITFADFNVKDGTGSIREILNYYLQSNLVENFTGPDDINKSELLKNVTSVIDLPKFCNYIQISNDVQYTSDKFVNDLDLFKKSKSPLPSLKNGIDTKRLTYEFYNPRITNVDFGSFDYSSDDINEISVTFVPQWVVIK